VLLIALAGGVGSFLVMLGLIAIIVCIVSLVTHRPTWARLPQSRGATTGILAASIAVLLIGSGVSSATQPTAPPMDLAIPSATPSPTPTQVADAPPADPETVQAWTSTPSVAVADSSATQTTAIALLESLPVKGRAPKTGYDRSGQFGTAWLDVDHNGCDTRNDILARDLLNETLSGPCKVLSGSLPDPYTGRGIDFVRGNKTSLAVQIDHVVALLDAWQKGAQQLTPEQRISFANDPLNLLAVDGPANAGKGAGDAATWLPANKAFRCEYASRQVSVKATYGLWVTQPEHDTLARILGTCAGPAGLAFTSSFTPVAPPPPPPAPVAPAPKPAPVVAPPPPPPAPEPAPPAPAPATVHPGSFCSQAGATGVTTAGTAMVCITTATDSRLRWRSAG